MKLHIQMNQLKNRPQYSSSEISSGNTDEFQFIFSFGKNTIIYSWSWKGTISVYFQLRTKYHHQLNYSWKGTTSSRFRLRTFCESKNWRVMCCCITPFFNTTSDKWGICQVEPTFFGPKEAPLIWSRNLFMLLQVSFKYIMKVKRWKLTKYSLEDYLE